MHKLTKILLTSVLSFLVFSSSLHDKILSLKSCRSNSAWKPFVSSFGNHLPIFAADDNFVPSQKTVVIIRFGHIRSRFVVNSRFAHVQTHCSSEQEYEHCLASALRSSDANPESSLLILSETFSEFIQREVLQSLWGLHKVHVATLSFSQPLCSLKEIRDAISRGIYEYRCLVVPRSYNYNGEKLKICAKLVQPYFYIDKDNNKYKGWEFTLLQILSEVHNFTFEISEPADRQWGSLGENNTWSGCIGMLVRGESDLTIGGYALNVERSFAVDNLISIDTHNVLIISKQPGIWEPTWRLLKPFDDEVWFCCIASTFIVWLIYLFFRKYSSPRLQAFSWPLYDACTNFEAAAVIIEKPMHELPKDNSSKVLLAFWMLASIIIVYSFRDNLISILFETKMDHGINSIEDLSASDKTILIYNDLFYKNVISSLSHLQSKLLYLDIPLVQILKMFFRENKYVLLDSPVEVQQEIPKYKNMTGFDTNIYLSKSKYTFVHHVLYATKLSPHFPILHPTLMRMMETGLVEMGRNLEIQKVSNPVFEILSRKITHRKMIILYKILLIGMSLSLMIFLAENILFASMKKAMKFL